jgi:acyl dehydratase
MFDPDAHAMHAPRPFDDFREGMVYRAPSRTITAAHFAAFQTLSGDNHPIHYDRRYLARQGHRDLMAHGYQTLALAAIGACPLAHEMGEALVGFLEQSSRFLTPVYLGDTLYPCFTITDIRKRKTTGTITVRIEIFNEDGQPVVNGTQTYLMRL